MVDGIICFNSIVTKETREFEVKDMAQMKWKIFTWSVVKDSKFNYAKVADMYLKEFEQWGFNYTVRAELTPSIYADETELGTEWKVYTRASINS